MKTPERTTAEVFPRYLGGEVLADSATLKWLGLFARRYRFPPLQFVIRERMLQAQQLIRETPRTLIEVALEVGYTSPSHFAQVFRRTVAVAPTQFRNAL